ncbi:phosphate propanoyltransferase [Candidatus Pacearchaeota archaeon]|nr:phosphate propanoyltransferase [Candidatus Pacearchaeota archaeon]
MKIRRDPNSRGRLSEGNRVGVLAPVEISARHVHLSEKDFEKLFGKNKKIVPIKSLSQVGEFASEEKISLIGNKKEIKDVRILGPFRKNSQAEISLTDAYHLKLNPPPRIKVSGDLANTTRILIKGPKASITIPCIIAQRHLHCSNQEAKRLKIKNNQRISVRTKGLRDVTFHNVVVRTGENFRLSLHLDTDEGNAAGIHGKSYGEIIKK